MDESTGRENGGSPIRPRRVLVGGIAFFVGFVLFVCAVDVGTTALESRLPGAPAAGIAMPAPVAAMATPAPAPTFAALPAPRIAAAPRHPVAASRSPGPCPPGVAPLHGCHPATALSPARIRLPLAPPTPPSLRTTRPARHVLPVSNRIAPALPEVRITVPFAAAGSLAPSTALDPRAGAHAALLIDPVSAGTPAAAAPAP
jgi:hypothetical protein